MKTFLPRSPWASVALLALAALVYLRRTPQPPAGQPDGPAGAAVNPDATRQQQSKLVDYEQDLARRLACRRRVLEGLIPGRLRLAEAAARFEELDQASPTFNWGHFREITPDASDEEKPCHAVIGHINTLLANDPDRAGAVTARLQEEFHAIQQQGAPAARGSQPPGHESPDSSAANGRR